MKGHRFTLIVPWRVQKTDGIPCFHTIEGNVHLTGRKEIGSVIYFGSVQRLLLYLVNGGRKLISKRKLNSGNTNAVKLKIQPNAVDGESINRFLGSLDFLVPSSFFANWYHFTRHRLHKENIYIPKMVGKRTLRTTITGAPIISSNFSILRRPFLVRIVHKVRANKAHGWYFLETPMRHTVLPNKA